MFSVISRIGLFGFFFSFFPLHEKLIMMHKRMPATIARPPISILKVQVHLPSLLSSEENLGHEVQILGSLPHVLQLESQSSQVEFSGL